MHPTLLVLAAGLGSRYGGLKQIDPVGPSGETVLDYAVFDALRAGFGRVVFIIRRDFEEVFRAQIGAKYTGRIAVDYVFQALDALPGSFTPSPDREKPWGTGHAVWCARDAIREPFAVINADDFYGRDSFARLGCFLTGPALTPRGFDPMSGHRVPSSLAAPFAMVGFRLDRTLSEHGAVARGLCTAGADGRLTSIVEHTGILPEAIGPGKKYTGAETVSLNCWAFTPALFAGLDAQWRTFLAERGDETRAEFYLPAAISTMIVMGAATVDVLPTDSSWFGATYREDKPLVAAALAELVRAGQYPDKLF